MTLPTSAFPSLHIVGSLTSKLPSNIQPKYCHTDTWQLDEANCTLTRIHKRPRRTIGQTAPVEMDRLTGIRITTMDFGEGRVETVTEYFRQLANQNEKNEGTLERKDCFSTLDFFSAA